MKWALIATLNFGTQAAHQIKIDNYDTWADCFIASINYLQHSTSGTAATCVIRYAI